jgi:hypothetical protein
MAMSSSNSPGWLRTIFLAVLKSCSVPYMAMVLKSGVALSEMASFPKVDRVFNKLFINKIFIECPEGREELFQAATYSRLILPPSASSRENTLEGL